MLTKGDQIYYEQLKDHLKALPRVKFIEPVSMDQVPHYLNQFDIGYYILPPVNFNTASALPNKLFEYVQARLCLAFGPSPEMKRIIRKYGIGIVSESFEIETMARALNELTLEQINQFKQQTHAVAKSLSAEENQRIIVQSIQSILN